MTDPDLSSTQPRLPAAASQAVRAAQRIGKACCSPPSFKTKPST